MAGSDEVIGMAGSFIAAVLETAGLYSMSDVLDNFQNLLRPLALLAYIACLIAAASTYVLQRSTRGAAYLLIAPPIFYFLLFWRVPAQQTLHQYGSRASAQSQAEVQKAVGSMMKRVNPDARVPKVFALYDDVVSSGVQTLVTFLLDTQNNEDLIQAARDRVLAHIVMVEGVEEEFLRLLAMSLMSDCARQTALAKELAGPRLAEAAPGSPEAAEAARKQALYLHLREQRQTLPRSVMAYVAAIELPVNAEEHTHIVPEAHPTCEQIWFYTRSACLVAGERLLRPSQSFIDEYPDLTAAQWDEIYAQIREKLMPESATDADLVDAFRIIAAFYLRNTASSSTHGSFTAQLEGRQDWLVDEDRSISKDTLDSLASKARSAIVDFAALIPYVQGMLLYILSLVFPFTSLFLLIPGRASSFFSWFWLWLWVKSWDVGFALVYQIREILWSFVPHPGDATGMDQITDLQWDDPSSVLHLVYANDPSTSLFTYYVMVSLITLLVPLMTGFLCRGASQIYYTVQRGWK